tara:strand:- start:268 stop:936 length:669 start_codon:yes stop_codon:yes gene_type:complete
MGAIKTDGTLWTWGRGTYGELGQNTSWHAGGTYIFSSPKQVGTDTTWSVVRGGNERTFAGKTDGTLWIWGSNQYGQLGQNQAGSYPTGAWAASPKQIGTSTDWNVSVDTMACGSTNNYAIKTDGSLWSWGTNFSGKLGDNTTIQRSSPVQVGTDTTWSKVAATSGSAFGLKTDGSLWSWGYNNLAGALGQNDRTARSSPTQLPGTWTIISATNYSLYGIKEG